MPQSIVPPRHGTPVIINHVSSEHLLNHPMRPLGLSIRLWMESCRVREAGAQQLHETRPKRPSEAWVSIADYGRRDAKVPHDTVKK